MGTDLFVLFAFADAADQVMLQEAIGSLVVEELKTLAESKVLTREVVDLFLL